MRLMIVIPVFSCLGLLLGSAGAVGRGVASLEPIDICYDYACNRRTPITLSEDEWLRLQGLFRGNVDSAYKERQRIRQAIALMEQVAGRQTPTFRDLGGNNKYQDDVGTGQMDCIDESTNTTRYLRLFEQYGLLRKHRVGERVSRAPYIFDYHWGALIEEIGSGQHYVVDSWHFDNGEPPVIQRLEDWLRKQDFDGTDSR